MKSHFFLLQIELFFQTYKFTLLCFITAFAVTLLAIPPVISLIRKYKLFDLPNSRKEHINPIPTMGGVAIVGGMMLSLFLWFPFSYQPGQVSFFFCITALLALGIMDDLKDLSARYKFVVQFSLAALIAASGIRISSFNGLFGIYELPVFTQYFITVLAITGITNAFNLIDGIDGLAGGLGFMSLLTLGFLLTLSGDRNTALIAFALGGGMLAFLYFNFNPARIFMGDTGSLVLGFVIAVLCIRLIEVNLTAARPLLINAPLIALSIVMIPVFDTLRVFAIRIWKGKSPFSPDKTHIHHLLTNQGFSHAFAARIICFFHAIVLMEAFSLRTMKAEWILLLLTLFMLLVTFLLKNLSSLFKSKEEFITASK
jgi:UDP-N-acetylmuramyl pentapeptide phosphotransferase/UDP-N-acetylglucosamine-1-phosphate transferase